HDLARLDVPRLYLGGQVHLLLRSDLEREAIRGRGGGAPGRAGFRRGGRSKSGRGKSAGERDTREGDETSGHSFLPPRRRDSFCGGWGRHAISTVRIIPAIWW